MDNKELNINTVANTAQKSKAKLIAKIFLLAICAGCVVYFIINLISHDPDAAPFFGIFISFIVFVGLGRYYGFVKPSEKLSSRFSCTNPDYLTSPLNPASPNYQSLYDEYRSHLH